MASGKVGESEFQPMNPIILQVLKSICKIKYDNHIGTGFLIKFIRNGKDFLCLMTCEHIISKII